MPERYIYLDHSASTPVNPQVVEEMMPYFSEVYGNPSSIHHFARQSEKGVEESRRMVANIFNCNPSEVVFTSCGSESDNLAIRGAALTAKAQGKRPHLISSPLEHSAVGQTVQHMGDYMDCDVTFLKMEKDGTISPQALADAIQDNTVLITLMYANNEIGTILPIKELAAVAHEHGVWFHTDAVQAAGQMPLDVQELGVDMLSISAHKFYGPKGVGALFVRQGIDLVPSQSGGSHEEGRRAGTLNVPLIVGLGQALKIAYEVRDEYVAHVAELRDKLIDGILSTIPEAELTGSPDHRLPSHASFVFHHVNGNQLLMQLDNKGIAASSGSACKTGNPKPSGLLMELGYDEAWAFGGLRLTVGKQTTHADIDYVLELLPKEVDKVRQLAGLMT